MKAYTQTQYLTNDITASEAKTVKEHYSVKE